MSMLVLTKACLIGLLGVMSLETSSRATAQLQPYPDDPMPQESKKKPDKIELLYKISEYSLAGATGFDVWTTAQGMDHPTSAWTSSGKFLTDYHVREVGWAGCFGDRNMFAATTANAGLNAGLEFLGRRLDRRGGRWRIAGIALIAGKTAFNTVAAVHNLRFQAGINKQVSLATGYNGPVVWH